MDLTTIYLICFGVGLVFAIVSTFLAEVFGGHDAHAGHAEAGFDVHHMPGFSVFSPTTIASNSLTVKLSSRLAGAPTVT